MTGQRSAVQNSAVRSAYCPPLALVAADSAAMPGSLTAVDLWRRAGRRVIEVPGRTDRHQ